MNISKNTPKENGKKKMKRFLLDKIGGREIGISAKTLQIKTTAKKSFLFFCSSLLIAMGILCPMAIDVYADVPIITQVKTMAELILTLTAGAGTVITQPTIVNPIISEFGSADYQMQSLVDNGAFNLYDKTTGEVLNISTEDAIDHIGDLDWLTENNAEFKMDYDTFSNKVSAANTLAKSGANIIHQAALQTGNPMEWDWGELIQTYLNQGKLSYELYFTDFTTGNTITEDMQSILGNIIDFFAPNIENNIPLDIDMSNLNSGNNYAIMKSNNYGTITYNTFSSNGGIIIGFNGTGGPSTAGVCYCNNTDSIVNYGQSTGINSNTNLTHTLQPRTYATSTINNYATKEVSCKYKAATENDAKNMARAILDGSTQMQDKPYEYLINPTLGNVSPEDMQTLSPSIEQGQAIIPFDQSAYQDLINDVNDNTNNNVPEDNPSLVYPFIQDYIIDSNQGNPNPSDPERPVNPSQPSIPDKEPITDEEMETNLTGTTVGLEEIFPFCIPFDIVKLIKGLRAERRAPVIDWTFESDLFGFSYTFHIDLSEFNDVAAILRTMELIVFIIGLAVATRKLIGAGG